MNNTANIAGKLLPSLSLNEYAFSGISDEEWEALGINPFRIGELEKQMGAEVEQPIQSVNSFT
ncbi:MAG: hypothetical protein Q7S46_06465 [Gallionella sp.]|nr:hypothetical protein [Gallionella sp.]